MLPATTQTKIPAALPKAVKLRYNPECDRVIKADLGEISDEDRRQSIAALEARLAERLPMDEIKNHLGRIKLMTGSKNRTQEDLTAEINVFAEGLGQHPAYAVSRVLWDWPASHQWWPTYAELTAAIDRECSKYRQTLKALKTTPGEKPRTGRNPEDKAYVLEGFQKLREQWEGSK